MINAQPATGLWECTDEVYFGDAEHVSASMLEIFRRSVPLFHDRFIGETIHAPEPTPAMRFGTLVHSAVLEPDTFADRYAVAPECDLRTKDGKATWAAFQAHAGDKELIDAESHALAWSMSAAVLKHSVAGELIRCAGRNEIACRWEDRFTGLPCKAKLDRLLPEDGGRIIDLKTAIDPSPEEWARQAFNLKYHHRAAHYLSGCEQLGLAKRFTFVVVGKEPPHEVGVYELDPEALGMGFRQVRDLMTELQRRAASGDWTSRFASGIQTAFFPPWAYKN